MADNSKYIRNWLDEQLTTKHKFETFAFYMLKKLEIVKLEVMQTDVPMVFEVINDRGVRLKPHEILKGKLLGQIDKEELEKYDLNSLWEVQVNLVGVGSSNNDLDEIDNFFETFIRSKIANTRGAAEKYNSRNYHRALFNGEVENYFKLNRNAENTKKFLQNDFLYFTNLYCKVKRLRSSFHPGFEHLYFNQLNDLFGHYNMILSACKVNDPEEDEKIRIIGYEYDKLFAMLQLQKAYVNNIIGDLLYFISKEIREVRAENIQPIFEKYIISSLTEIKTFPIVEIFNYNYFKDVGYSDLPTRFSRYFFSRIEYFLCNESLTQMQQSFEHLVRNSGVVNGHHIEHILSHNEENLRLFNNDVEIFERERNRLGGLLLLKGNTNQSSGNELYADKLRTYAQTLLWNSTLHPDTYHSNIDLRIMMEKNNLVLRPMNHFGPEELEERHRLLEQIIKIIWS